MFRRAAMEPLWRRVRSRGKGEFGGGKKMESERAIQSEIESKEEVVEDANQARTAGESERRRLGFDLRLDLHVTLTHQRYRRQVT